MNPYRIAHPPRWWQPALRPRLIRLLRPLRQRQRVRDHRLLSVDVHGAERVRKLLDEGTGVLITPNHPTHADAYAMYEVSDAVGLPFHFMATWNIFERRTRLGQRLLQWHGVFSIDREGTDLQAFKQAVKIVRQVPFPLVIFPEGEVYHCNDRITPFREGAAMVAISAAKRAKRPVVCVPCAMKYEYLEDPTESLLHSMAELEQNVHWRPCPEDPLDKRIYRLANALLALKEMEFYGHATEGPLPERVDVLAKHILRRLEQRHEVTSGDSTVPERVKELRRRTLAALEDLEGDDARNKQLNDDLDDLFLVVQLFSYPGDYVSERPTIERLAETLDKFEEDALNKHAATPRAARKATVYLGEPIRVEGTRKREAAAALTDLLEQRVQEMLDRHGAG